MLCLPCPLRGSTWNITKEEKSWPHNLKKIIIIVKNKINWNVQNLMLSLGNLIFELESWPNVYFVHTLLPQSNIPDCSTINNITQRKICSLRPARLLRSYNGHQNDDLSARISTIILKSACGWQTWKQAKHANPMCILEFFPVCWNFVELTDALVIHSMVTTIWVHKKVTKFKIHHWNIHEIYIKNQPTSTNVTTDVVYICSWIL